MPLNPFVPRAVASADIVDREGDTERLPELAAAGQYVRPSAACSHVERFDGRYEIIDPLLALWLRNLGRGAVARDCREQAFVFGMTRGG